MAETPQACAGAMRSAGIFPEGPQLKQAGEIIRLGVETGMQRVGLIAIVDGALPRVVDGQCGDDGQHLFEDIVVAGGHEHAGQPRFDRKTCELAPQWRHVSLLVNRSQFMQLAIAFADHAWQRRLDKGERLDIAKS